MRASAPTRLALSVVAVLVAAAVAAVPAGAAGPDVEAVASRTYIHGITATLAGEALGAPAVPRLHVLLSDPDFPRPDNVVAFLAYLGGPETTVRLTALLDRPAPLDTPERERALLLVPEALGRIAGRGEPHALERLLELSDPGFRLPAAVRVAPRPLRDAVVEQSVRALGFTRSAAARARLEALQRSAAGPAGRDLSRPAAEALAWFDDGATSRGAAPPSAPIDLDRGAAQRGTPPSARMQETGVVAHAAALDHVNHVALALPIDDARTDQVLTVATLIAGRADSLGDVACCLRLRRASPGGVFGSPNDGLNVIDSSQELGQVLAVATARVKVVQAINWCSGPGTNIIGCATVGGDSFVVVRASSSQLEAVLWLHEYGHNVGLEHIADDDNVMSAIANTGAIELNPAQCAAHHDPPPSAGSLLTEIGGCDDADHDNVASGADNCAATSNQTQFDGDRDGSGDVCDNCRDDANADQADLDADGTGDVCDPDDDGDAIADGTDCRPLDATVWSAPAAVDDLLPAGSVATFAWSAPADPGGTAPLAYDVLRAPGPAGFAAASPLSCGGAETTWLDPDLPGAAFFYLVRVGNACGKSLGVTSDGTERPAVACP